MGIVKEKVLKGLAAKYVKETEFIIQELNDYYGFNCFDGMYLKNVYSLYGGGIIYEFRDRFNRLSVSTDFKGNVLSCRIIADGIEWVGLQRKYHLGSLRKSVVLE